MCIIHNEHVKIITGKFNELKITLSQYSYRLPSPEQDIICVLHGENIKMR